MTYDIIGAGRWDEAGAFEGTLEASWGCHDGTCGEAEVGRWIGAGTFGETLGTSWGGHAGTCGGVGLVGGARLGLSGGFWR